MSVGQGFILATDAQFKELSNFSTPPRAGRITAIEPSGQVRVESDDPDGGDILAWPLNGFSYAVGDVVYLLFAVNSPDSALVIGSVAPLPELDAGVIEDGRFVEVDGSTPLTAEWDIGEDMAIRAERLEARDNEGLTIQDDGGNTGVMVHDGGQVSIGSANAPVANVFLGVSNNVSKATAGAANVATFGSSEAPSSQLQLLYQLVGKATAALRGALIQALEQGVGFLHLRIQPYGGYTAFGNFVPQAPVHIHDGVGGWMFVTKTFSSVTQTVIPDGTGDVVGVARARGVGRDSAGVNWAIDVSAAVGADNDMMTDGTNIVKFRVNANGSCDIRRTGGTRTYIVAVEVIWT